MPVNLYDGRKVSLRRPHGNGDLDIVQASYTRGKANVTEALGILEWDPMKDHKAILVSIQCRAIIGSPPKSYSNGVLLEGR